MSDTPNEEWFVTEYPVSGVMAVADRRGVLVTICGGKTLGEAIDLATRIARLPALERELAEAREQRDRLAEALDTLTLVVGLTPIAGNKEALQEAMDAARSALAAVKGGSTE